jgi:gas vesicle protein
MELVDVGRTPTPLPPRRRRPRTGPVDAGDRTSGFVAGLAMGLAIGAGVALLLAPQSGSEARYSISRAARRLRRRGNDAWEDLGDELRRYRRKSRRRREASSL